MSDYFILRSKLKGCMLLAPLKSFGDDESWTISTPFVANPPAPVIAKIRDGYETAVPPTFMSVPPIMSYDFAKLILKAGVTKIDFYEAELHGANQIKLKGFRAYNLLKDPLFYRREDNSIVVHKDVCGAIKASGFSSIEIAPFEDPFKIDGF